MNKIYLSASTQENNWGVSDYGTEEDNMFYLRDRIEYFILNGGHGSSFKIYKNNDKSMTLRDIVKHSNNFNVDSHWSNHSNAGFKSARGCESYYHYNTPHGKGDRMALLWYNEISRITQTGDRGAKKDNTLYSKGLYELRYTKAPAALMEHFFHSNDSDVKFYKANIDLFAIASAMAIYKYYNLKYSNYSESKSYLEILKEVSNYSDIWIEFVKNNPDYNLKGLIQMLYYSDPKK